MTFESFKGFVISSFLVVASPVSLAAEDKELKVPPVVEVKPKSEWSYQPQDAQFWAKVEELKSEKKFKDLLAEGARRLRLRTKNSPEADEGALVAAQALKELGYKNAALMFSIDLARRQSNTEIGTAALELMSQLTLEQVDFDRQLLEEYLVGNEVGRLPAQVQSFVSSFRYLYDLRFGNHLWAKKNRELILPKSPWDYDLKYWEAIGAIARDKPDFAKTQFETLSTEAETPELLKRWSTLQLARLAFEAEKYTESMDLYQKVGDLGLREKGRVLLEKAWNKYYLKQYDKALGLLTALKAPYFFSSLSPERFVLEAIIYRDLCLYDSAHGAVTEYQRIFSPIVSAIRKRSPLRQNSELVKMALMNRDLQPRANLIESYRREREGVSESGMGGPLLKGLLAKMKSRENRLMKELDIELEPRLRLVANEILARDEQIQFLDYSAKLDKLRIVHNPEERDFKSERVSYLTFDSTYWPVEKEFWWDEFGSYKVLLSSQCQVAKSGVDPKTEREFK